MLPYAVDLLSDAHALSRRVYNETEIMGQAILSCEIPLALDLMSGTHAADCICRHLHSLNHE